MGRKNTPLLVLAVELYTLQRIKRMSGGWTSLIAQLVKNLPATQETCVQFLSQEDPLEKEMAIHSSILAWKIPWTGEPYRLQLAGLQFKV